MTEPSRNPELKTAYILKEAAHEDIKSIIDIERQVWIDAYPNEEYGITKIDVEERFNPAFIIQRGNEIEKELQEGHRYMIAVRDNQVVGYSHGLKLTEYNDLVEVYTTEQQKGVGRLLMQNLFSWFGNEKPIRLEVAVYNTNAIKVYEHYGFKVKEDLHQDPEEVWNVLPRQLIQGQCVTHEVDVYAERAGEH